jgi:RNA polymerase sigma factor (sigma-70 family)
MVLLTTYNDEQPILEAIARGEKRGLEWLYKHSFITTKKMVIKMGGDEDEAWDVFQEAATLFYEKCSTEGIYLQCKINTYITSVARNLWLKKVKQRYTVTLEEELDNTADVQFDVAEFLQKEKDLAKLELALVDLGEPCAALMKAFYFEGKSMQQIGEQFGYTNADNAKTQKYKCLTRLKKIFFDKAAATTKIAKAKNKSTDD